jgi:hypothetical protein
LKNENAARPPCGVFGFGRRATRPFGLFFSKKDAPAAYFSPESLNQGIATPQSVVIVLTAWPRGLAGLSDAQFGSPGKNHVA